MARRRGILYIGGVLYEVDDDALRRALAAWSLTNKATAPISDLSNESGTARCTVWRFLNGRPIGLASAQRISQALRVELSDLLRPLTPSGRAVVLRDALELARRLTELLERLEAQRD